MVAMDKCLRSAISSKLNPSLYNSKLTFRVSDLGAAEITGIGFLFIFLSGS